MPAAASMHPCVMSSSLRRSTMSPNAPAGTPSRKTGRLVAVWTSATSNAEEVSVAMDHPAPTFCIHVPILDAMDAIHSQRNQVYRSVVHALCAEDFARSNSYSKQTVGQAIAFCGLSVVMA